jgi:Holliday junction resolvase RusA-like endonuclease
VETPLLAFQVFGTPVTQGSKIPGVTRAGKPYMREAFSYTLTRWRAELRQVAREEMKRCGVETRPGSVILSVGFTFQRPASHFYSRHGLPTTQLKPWAPEYYVGNKDVDKLLRAVLDALQQAKLYAFDNRVVHVRDLLKIYGDSDGVGLEVWDAPARVRARSEEDLALPLEA